jgi:hypothetical protein
MAEASYNIRGRQIDGQELETIRDLFDTQVRQDAVNHVDETSWHKNDVLMWL